MSRTAQLPCGTAIPLILFHTLATASEGTPSEVTSALTHLRTSLERLTAVIEQQSGSLEDRRAEVAATLLGFWSRRIDHLETELRQNTVQIEDLRINVATLRAEADRFGESSEEGPPEMLAIVRRQRDQTASQISQMEARIRVREDRRLEIQAELHRELQRASGLEAILDDWLKRRR
jgi:hypothetical protein